MSEHEPHEKGIFFSCISPTDHEGAVRTVLRGVRGAVLNPESQEPRTYEYHFENAEDVVSFEGVHISGFALNNAVYQKLKHELSSSDITKETPLLSIGMRESEVVLYNPAVKKQ